MPVGSRLDVVDQSFVPTLQKSWLPSPLVTSRRADDLACTLQTLLTIGIQSEIRINTLVLCGHL